MCVCATYRCCCMICRCSTTNADTAASLTVNYPCNKGLSRVVVANRRDCCQAKINKFKLSFVKNNGTSTAAEYTFTGGLAGYSIPGPNK